MMIRFVFFVLPFLSVSPTDCDTNVFVQECIAKIPTGFLFLKGYPIENKANDQVEYSYVFTKGTTYFISLNESSSKNIVIEVYNYERKMVASSRVNGQIVSNIIYSCNATGIFYTRYLFTSEISSCGGSALSFKR